MSEKEKIEEALAEAIAVIYFADNADYQSALYRIVEILGGSEAVELLENDERSAYKKYVDSSED